MRDRGALAIPGDLPRYNENTIMTAEMSIDDEILWYGVKGGELGDQERL